MSASGDWLAQVKAMAGESAQALQGHLDERLRPHAARILAESAAVAIRAAAGEDVTTARMALEASTASLAREAKAVVALEGRNLALRAAWALLLGPAAGGI